ncbi:DUF748 domain-containing protein [Shewanella donghaensis]|uniref:DUF748 domain-containing protein n=1 Tax=Shewanella donghaensis TaxID=238836 RepID=UPI001184334D|nr:DUF748 domain-containing protein [Shewanella donghaensis]
MKSPLNTIKLAFSNRPRYQKVAITCSVLYLLFIILLGLIVPFIAIKQAPKSLSTLLGRQVSIEAIKVNPFSFELSIENINIAEADSTSPFVHINHVSTDIMVWQSIFNLDISLDYLTIDGTNLALTRFNSLSAKETSSKTPYAFNFSDILTTIAQNTTQQPESNPPQDNNEQAINLNINTFSFTNATLNVRDDVTDTSLSYDNIKATLEQFSTAAQLNTSPESNKFSFTLDDNQTGKVALNGQIQLDPLVLNGQLDVNTLSATPYWNLVDSLFEATLTSADINLHAEFSLNQASKEQPIETTLANTRFSIEHINAKDSHRNIASIGLIALDGINVSTSQRELLIDELQTNNADFWLTVEPEKINLVKLFSPRLEQLADILGMNHNEDKATSSDKATENKTHSTTEASPWLVTLNKLTLSEYKIEATESVANKVENYWLLSGLTFSSEQIKSDLSVPINYQFGVDINNQSRFDSTGVFDANMVTLEADIDYNNVNLVKLQPYISPFMNITLESGLFHTKGHVSADAEDKLVYNGEASVIDLKIKDNLIKQPLLNWQAMTINELIFDKTAKSLSIDQILFDTLFSRLIISEDRSTNIADLIVTPKQSHEGQDAADKSPQESPDVATQITTATNAAEAETATESESFKLSINKIAFKDSSAFFADNSLTPNFASGIEQLNGEITQLSTNPDTRASVDLAGKIDKYAPVTLKGDLNPLLANPYLDLNLAFNKVELTSINPYSGTYAGYYIDKGQLSLALKYQLEDNQLVGSNHLVIDQLKLGKPTDSSLATSLPITLAIALLQDRHGVIDLGVDVDGDLDSPSFSIGSIVMTAITNVITKAITAPFSLLAGLVGGDEEMDKVSFEFGEAVINDEQQTTLSTLANALNDRPLLMLNVKGGVNLASDQQALQVKTLHAKLAEIAQLPIESLPADLSASNYPQQGALAEALVVLYQTELQLDPLLIQQTIKQENPEITQEDLQTRWYIALYNFTVNNQNITEAKLGDLAQQRAKAVKTYLVEQAMIEPSRIFLLESRVHMDQTDALATLTLDAN